MRKKGVFIGVGVLVVATAAILFGMAPGKSAILEPVPGVTYVSRDQALRKPFIDWNTPFGRWTLPAPARGLEDAKNRLRKQPNLAGVLVFSGNMLDMMPRMKLDGVQYSMQSDSQWTAQYVFLPTVYGASPKEATVEYGDFPPVRVELPATGSPAPPVRERFFEVGPYKVRIASRPGVFKLPRPESEVSFEGGRPGEILSVTVFGVCRPLKAGVRVRFGLVESQIKSPVPISLQPVIARETEVIVSRVSNSVTLRDREGIWTGEATVDPTHMSYTVGDPTVLGWIHIPGLPIGVPKPTEPSLPPGYLPDPWPELRALKDGQKLPATIYRPSGKRLVSSTNLGEQVPTKQ